MQKVYLKIILPPVVFAILGGIALAWWVTYDPTKELALQVPGMDGRPQNLDTETAAIRIGEYGETLSEKTPPVLPGAWPRFRGPDINAISPEKIELADQWGPNEPEILWSVKLGEGHAAPAVLAGRVYVLDYDEEFNRDVLRCFALADGTELWRRGYQVKVQRNHGMSRTIPAVTEDYVVTMGPKCQVMCVDAQTGDFRWGMDLVKDYGAEVPMWYTGQCPLIDDGVAVIAAGGEELLLGVDCETGDILWSTPNPGGLKMSHSSVIPAEIDGVKMYVYCATGGMVGVSAEPGEQGKLLWQAREWNRNVIAPSPVITPDGWIFVTAGYGGGSMTFHVQKAGDSFVAEVLDEVKPSEGLASEQQTPILFQDHLFAILPKDGGTRRNQLVCVSTENIREIVWASGKTNRFGLGPYIIADGKLYILSDDGELTMARATLDGYEELDSAQILDGHDAWGPLALVGGRMLMRDSQTLVCVDLRKD